MALTNFPQGVSSMGFPMIGSGPFMTLGNVWFVNSAGTGAADANGYGTDIKRPFKTLAFALTKAAAHDYIFLAAGHSEAIATAVYMNIALNDVTIVGLGNGTYRPTFQLTTVVGATFTISGNAVRIVNCIFDFTGVNTVAVGITVTGTDCLLENCRFIQATGANIATNGITVSGARLTIINADWDSSAAAGAATAIASGAANAGLKLLSGRIRGDFSTAIFSSTAALHLTDILLDDLTLYNKNAVKNLFNLTAGSTGEVRNCTFVGNGWASAADAIANSGGILVWAQNFGIDDDTGAASAVLVPAVGTIG